MTSTTTTTTTTNPSTTTRKTSRTTTSTTDGPSCLALGLGSNVGDSEATLRWAIARLEELLGRLEVAPLYRTAPVSTIPQPDFLNTVVIARLEALKGSRLADPRALLAQLKSLERESGRNGGPRFGPRTLDVDLLLFGDLILPASGGEPELVLPHPRMRQRRFVLAPLCDLRPDLELPPDGAVARDLLAELGTEQAVERLGWS